jgi:hypothetical protein
MNQGSPPPSDDPSAPPKPALGGVVVHQPAGAAIDEGTRLWGRSVLSRLLPFLIVKRAIDRARGAAFGLVSGDSYAIAVGITLPAPAAVIDHEDRDQYEFWLNGDRIDQVFQAMPEDGWLKVFGTPQPKRLTGRIEAVHKETGVVRRTEWK